MSPGGLLQEFNRTGTSLDYYVKALARFKGVAIRMKAKKTKNLDLVESVYAEIIKYVAPFREYFWGECAEVFDIFSEALTAMAGMEGRSKELTEFAYCLLLDEQYPDDENILYPSFRCFKRFQELAISPKHEKVIVPFVASCYVVRDEEWFVHREMEQEKDLKVLWALVQMVIWHKDTLNFEDGLSELDYLKLGFVICGKESICDFDLGLFWDMEDREERSNMRIRSREDWFKWMSVTLLDFYKIGDLVYGWAKNTSYADSKEKGSVWWILQNTKRWHTEMGRLVLCTDEGFFCSELEYGYRRLIDILLSVYNFMLIWM
jgi:hypothetical protein